MTKVLETLNDAAANNFGLVSRSMVVEHGGSDRLIGHRLGYGHWHEVHPGVYLIGATPLTWNGRLRAATMAAGSHAAGSHRAASVLWGLDGVTNAPIEITVPMGKGPVPAGVIVHRTRRPIEPTVVRGIPVTSVERTILDLAWDLPPVIIEQAYDSALRRRLTTPLKMADCVSEKGTAGVRGVRKVVVLLDARRPGRPTGSPLESFLLNKMRRAGLEEPERQFAVILPDGTVAVLDFAWPRPRKAVEVDGLDAHGSARALEYDLARQNLLFEVRWQLRRFSGRMIRRQPDQIVAEIARFLAA